MTSILFDKIFGDIIPAGTNTNQKNIMIPCIFHDDKNASLCISTDENKPVYNCFGCNEKGSWIGFYMKRNGLTYPEALKALDMDKPFEQRPVKQIIAKEPPQRVDTDYTDYCYKVWNDTIMHDEFYKDKKCVGYEIRHKLFQHFKFKNGKDTKCYKADNTPSCLCWIYEARDNKKCIINEGFVDSYFQYQYQYEKAQKFKGELAQVDCNILTSSCGVKHIPELVEQAKLWNDFDEIIFCLDNDDAGRDAKEKLLALPHENKFRFFNMLEDGEDFEEFYKRVLLKELYK